MKFRRRIVSIVLAALLICAMALPASAGSSTMHGNYNGSTWEISDTCYEFSYVSTTYCDDHSYYVKSDVAEYTRDYVTQPDGSTDFVEFWVKTVRGSAARIASTTRGSTTDRITKIICMHYVENARVYDNVLIP